MAEDETVRLAEQPDSLVQLEMLAEEKSRKAGRNWKAAWARMQLIRGGLNPDD